MKSLIIFILFIVNLDLYAASIEYCAGSQLNYKNAGSGGTGGHAFIYVEGLCKDYTKSYPQVIPCSEVSENHKNRFPHQGVGISLDSELRNVSWIAVPGREVFFGVQSVDELINHSIKYKVFDGVKLHEKDSLLNGNLFSNILDQYGIKHEIDEDQNISLDQKTISSSQYSYKVFSTLYTMGTDIAINNARDLACVKLPIDSPYKLRKLARYLNKSNQMYYKTNKSYVWHMLMNNCTHLSLNAVNKLGFDSPYYKVRPYLKSGSLKYFAKDLIINRKNAIKNMMTPADGFQLITKNLGGEKSFYPVKNDLDYIFDINELKVFSFDALTSNEYFLNDLQSLQSQRSWLKRNLIFSDDFYKKYKKHFYRIETLVKQ